MDAPAISIIIPTLNERENIRALVTSLQQQDPATEIIIVDGGSTDDTLSSISDLSDVVVKQSAKGRARQMNTGAQIARGDPLVFLHADTLLPPDFTAQCAGLPANAWGHFKVKLSGKKLIFKIIAKMMNIRSRSTSVITGDMAMTIRRTLFADVAGFSDIPIMEDVDISKKLRRHSRPICFNSEVTTSSRRWENRGIYKTIFLMWRLRLGYFLKVSPNRLAKKY